MALLTGFLHWGLLAWFAALACVVTWRVSRTEGLGDVARLEVGARLDPGRVANVVIIALTLGGFLLGASRGLTTGRMPDVPPELLALLVGGNALYLAGKQTGRANARAAKKASRSRRPPAGQDDGTPSQ